MNQEQQLQAIRERWRSANRVPWGVISFSSPRLATAEQEVVDISIWSAPREAYDAVCVVQNDVDTLLRMVEERDGLIHDLQLDGDALARRAVEEFSLSLVAHLSDERLNAAIYSKKVEWAALDRVIQMIQRKTADHVCRDPLPPDQECERLRAKLQKIREQIGTYLDVYAHYQE